MIKKISQVMAIVLSILLLNACSSTNQPKNLDKEIAQSIALSKSDLDFQNAEFIPGDVFKEYHWGGSKEAYQNHTLWQRVTSPESKSEDAKRFLPNPINTIIIDDLTSATKVEMVMEMWGGHYGTYGRKVKINGNEWIDIPECSTIGTGQPGDRPQDYMQFRYPVISIPIDQLKQGENTFEFTCYRPEGAWGQFVVNWVIFRVHYSEDRKPLTARVTQTQDNTDSAQASTFGIETNSPTEKIKKVDYIGLYEDYDYDGDGIYKEWVYNYRHGVIEHHIGSSEASPFQAKWDSQWIPDQELPVKVVARITDVNGMSYITPVLKDITLNRTTSVKMFKSVNVKKNFSAAKGSTESCKFEEITDLSNVKAVLLETATWNCFESSEVRVNDTLVGEKIGENHEIAYRSLKVPLEALIQGTNKYSVMSKTTAHAAEIDWPGFALKVQYTK